MCLNLPTSTQRLDLSLKLAQVWCGVTLSSSLFCFVLTLNDDQVQLGFCAVLAAILYNLNAQLLLIAQILVLVVLDSLCNFCSQGVVH